MVGEKNKIKIKYRKRESNKKDDDSDFKRWKKLKRKKHYFFFPPFGKRGGGRGNLRRQGEDVNVTRNALGRSRAPLFLRYDLPWKTHTMFSPASAALPGCASTCGNLYWYFSFSRFRVRFQSWKKRKKKETFFYFLLGNHFYCTIITMMMEIHPPPSRVFSSLYCLLLSRHWRFFSPCCLSSDWADFTCCSRLLSLSFLFDFYQTQDARRPSQNCLPSLRVVRCVIFVKRQELCFFLFRYRPIRIFIDAWFFVVVWFKSFARSACHFDTARYRCAGNAANCIPRFSSARVHFECRVVFVCVQTLRQWQPRLTCTSRSFIVS